MFLIKTALFVLTYFETNYDKYNPVGKKSATQELIAKMVVLVNVIFFNFIFTYFTDSIIVLSIMGTISLLQLYYYYIFPTHYNHTLLRANLCSKAVNAWCFVCILLGRFSKFFEVLNSNLLIFIFGIPLIFLVTFSKEHDRLDELISLSKRQENGIDYIRIVDILLEQLDEIESRSAQIILSGYAFFIESTCSLLECPLKKYISSLNNTKEASIFLLKHIETVFNNGINKYYFCIPLRISYCRFLIERLNKKNYALNEFVAISNFSQNFEEQFIIFRYKQLFEEYGYFKFKEYDVNIYNSQAFYQLTIKFQNLILKVTLLYIDFWSLLYQNNHENHNDLRRLNKIGTQIRIEVNEIEELFVEVNKEIHNEKEILMLYYDFVSEVLHDNNKKKILKSKLLELEDLANDDIIEKKLENFDIHLLSKTDRFLYMVINGQFEQIGRIIDASLSICSHLGYTKPELCGANIDDLIPRTLRKGHGLMMKNKVDNYVKMSMEFTHSKLEYHDIIAFAINKFKYLIPFAFKQCYIHTENKEDYWLIKIIKDQRSNNKFKTCYIITDLNMNIQNFTANSMQLLGLNSFAITNSVDITRFIKEFHEEYLKKVLDQDDKSTENKLVLKRQLILKKYKTPMIITWRKIDYQVNDLENSPSETGLDQMLKCSTNTLSTNISHNIFFLSVKKMSFIGQHYGFVFVLDQVQNEILTPVCSSDSLKKTSAMSVDGISTPLRNNSSNFNKQQQQLFKIDKNFIPSFKAGFNFDPAKLSYSVKPECLNKINRLDLLKYIKKEAFIKLKNNKPKNSNSSESSITSSIENNRFYYSDDDDDDDDDDESDSSKLAEENSNPTENSKLQLTKGDNNNSHNYNTNDNNSLDYYRVNFKKIKYSIFDYKTNRFIDQEDEKIPQIQTVMNKFIKVPNDKLNRGINTDKHNDNKETTKDDATNKYLSQIDNPLQTNDISTNKQIEEALKNEESQESIVKLGWISFVLFLVIIGSHCLFLGISLDCIQRIVFNIGQLENSYLILHVSLLSMFHVKELLYLQFEAYDDFYESKDKYISNNTAELTNLYIDMTDLVDKLTSTAMYLTSTNYIQLYYNFIQIDLIENETELFSYQLTITSSLSKLAAALFKITQLTQSERRPFQPDVFFFSRNIINFPYLALINQTDCYKDQFDSTIHSNEVKIILSFSLSCLVLLFTYFFIEKSLDSVIKKKESYLEVLYEIRGKIIFLSLQQCRSFFQKTQSSLNQGSNGSVDSDDDDASITDDDIEMLNKKRNDCNCNNKKVKSFERDCKKASSKEALAIKIRIRIALCLIVLLSSITFILFIEYDHTYNTYVKVYLIENKMKNNVLLGFNTIREYLYNQSSPVLGEDLREKINTLYNKHISTIEKLDNEMNQYESEFDKSYFATHEATHKISLCNYSFNFFDTFYPNDPNYNCSSILSGAAKYSISILLASFFDELNSYKNLYLAYEKVIESEIRNESTSSIIRPPVNEFNSHKMKELVIAVRYLILPIFNDLINNIIDEVKRFSQFQRTLFIVFEICFIVIVIAWFLFRWKCFVMSLSQIIFKTKNMLTIIPPDVLASLSSIHKVLKIKKAPAINSINKEDQYSIDKIKSNE